MTYVWFFQVNDFTNFYACFFASGDRWCCNQDLKRHLLGKIIKYEQIYIFLLFCLFQENIVRRKYLSVRRSSTLVRTGQFAQIITAITPALVPRATPDRIAPLMLMTASITCVRQVKTLSIIIFYNIIYWLINEKALNEKYKLFKRIAVDQQWTTAVWWW